MAFEGICPYFLRERKGYFYCECCRFKFPDAVARRKWVYRFCAHPSGWKECKIKKLIDDFYKEDANYEEKNNQKLHKYSFLCKNHLKKESFLTFSYFL